MEIEKIRITVCVLLAFFLYFVLYKKTVEEYYRDRLFAVRNDLFVMIADTSPDIFSHRSYKVTEGILNSTILMLEKFDFATVFIFAVHPARQFYPARSDKPRKKALKGEDKTVARWMLDAQEESVTLLVRYMFLHSPFAGAVFMLTMSVLYTIREKRIPRRNDRKPAMMNRLFLDYAYNSIS